MKVNLIWRVVLFGVFAVIPSVAAAQTPSPALVVAIRGAGDEHGLLIIDPVAKKVISNVPVVVHGAPHEVAVSADGKLAFMTNTGYGRDSGPVPDGTISVIDLVTQKELRRVDVGLDSIPHGIVAAGGKVYFTAEGYQTIERYDPASERIDWIFGTGQSGTHQLVVSKDTKNIFTATNDSNSVIAIQPWDHHDHRTPRGPRNQWMATVIPVGKGAEGIAMSPDEKEVWVLNHDDGSASIVSVADRKVSQTIDLSDEGPTRLQFTPDGKRVVIADENDGQILIIDVATRKEIKRFTKVGALRGVAISPDGSNAYLTDITGNDIVIVDLKKLEVTGRISTPVGPDGLSWAERK